MINRGDNRKERFLDQFYSLIRGEIESQSVEKGNELLTKLLYGAFRRVPLITY